jgi:hypothetical protein
MYDVFRNGLSHEYLIKTKNIDSVSFQILGVDNATQFQISCIKNLYGVDIISLDKKNFIVRIHNPKLIIELNLAFEKYKEMLLADHGNFRDRFLKRCEVINFESFA